MHKSNPRSFSKPCVAEGSLCKHALGKLKRLERVRGADRAAGRVDREKSEKCVENRARVVSVPGDLMEQVYLLLTDCVCV